MIMVMDTETRGLYGDIFLVGCFDGVNYNQFFTGKEFLQYLNHIDMGDEEISVYCFNLDFDLSKLITENNKNFTLTGETIFEIDYKKSLVINNRFHTARLLGTRITLRDLYPLVNTSLDKACKDFNLKTKKIDLAIEDKQKYFMEVSATCPKLQEYLKYDVLSTWELLQTLVDLSGLPIEKFVKCPTLASLSMSIYRVNSPQQYLQIKESYLTKEQENFIRLSYHGGRTEIFKHKLEDKGFHYDVNSLYPYVMKNYKYPTGQAYTVRTTMTNEERMTYFNKLRTNKVFAIQYFIHAKVYVPKQHVPPLPYRDKKGLIFPTGIFTGHFCAPEMEYAINHCNVQVLEIYNIILFKTEDNLFENFVGEQMKIKLTATGAKRTFSKLIQNSLYGKFGMVRKRMTYEIYTPERKEKLISKGNTVAVTNTYNNKQLMSYLKLAFADYIRPQYASLITSNARVELLKKLRSIPKESLYYCDTDSIVSSIPFQLDEIDNKEYGKWKLEREMSQAIYILPKLYAEIDNATGEEVLKSKGIVKDFQKTVDYNNYLSYYDSMVLGNIHILYGHGINSNITYYQRRKLMTAIKTSTCPDEKIVLQKRFLFSMIRQKRIYNFLENSSEPIDILDNSEYTDNIGGVRKCL